MSEWEPNTTESLNQIIERVKTDVDVAIPEELINDVMEDLLVCWQEFETEEVAENVFVVPGQFLERLWLLSRFPAADDVVRW